MAKKVTTKMVNMHNTLEEEFPSNSNANKVAPIRPNVEIIEEGTNIEEPIKEVRRNIKGRAVRKKKSILQSFFNEDTKNVGQYILFDVLIPAAKNMIQEMVTQGIEMFLFGEGSGGRSRSRDRGETKVSYSSMYKRRDEGRSSMRRANRGDKFGLDEIFFRDHNEAEEVLDLMGEHLEKYEQISVADFYDLAGIDGATWTHAKWGWENLRKAYCTHTRQGYAIVLPEPIELD